MHSLRSVNAAQRKVALFMGPGIKSPELLPHCDFYDRPYFILSERIRLAKVRELWILSNNLLGDMQDCITCGRLKWILALCSFQEQKSTTEVTSIYPLAIISSPI